MWMSPRWTPFEPEGYPPWPLLNFCKLRSLTQACSDMRHFFQWGVRIQNSAPKCCFRFIQFYKFGQLCDFHDSIKKNHAVSQMCTIVGITNFSFGIAQCSQPADATSAASWQFRAQNLPQRKWMTTAALS